MNKNIYIEYTNKTDQAAQMFLKQYAGYHIIAFYGEMGAGKTTFIKALCNKLGVTDMVSSPTFNIINEYFCENGSIIYHCDFYRIKNTEEALDIGIEEYFHTRNFCFIEWPEKIESLLPEEALKIKIEVTKHGIRKLFPKTD